MARLDRPRLDAAVFPVTAEIPVRYDDVDSLGHVNNAAAAVILQEARSHFGHAAGVADLRGDLRSVVAALSIEFAGEMHFPGVVEVSTGVVHLGRSSVTLAQVARQNGRTTLYAETVLVTADEAGPKPTPEAVRALYDRLRIREGAAG